MACLSSSILCFSLILLSMSCMDKSNFTMSSYIVLTTETSNPSTFQTQGEWHSSMISSLTDQSYGSIPFLSLSENTGLWPEAKFGDDVIIGLVDIGIWPESASFKDEGIGPILDWKGSCEFESSLCNNKLIGAKVFTTGYQNFLVKNVIKDVAEDYSSLKDEAGHDTHIASIATVNGKIAMYKACAVHSCAESDILAAMESAIQDEVHILLLYISGSKNPHYNNAIIRGAFVAEVLTASSPSISYSKMARGSVFENLKAKILFCADQPYNAFGVRLKMQEVGGIRFILMNPANSGEGLFTEPFTLLAAIVGYNEGLDIQDYIVTPGILYPAFISLTSLL
ncbi:hypothetical protein LguiB_032935 [Lonicera macranthoides]